MGLGRRELAGATSYTSTDLQGKATSQGSGLGSRNGNGGSSLPLPSVLLLPPSSIPLYSSLIPCNGVIHELQHKVPESVSTIGPLAVAHSTEREDCLDEYQDAYSFLHQSDPRDGVAIARDSDVSVNLKSFDKGSVGSFGYRNDLDVIVDDMLKSTSEDNCSTCILIQDSALHFSYEAFHFQYNERDPNSAFNWFAHAETTHGTQHATVVEHFIHLVGTLLIMIELEQCTNTCLFGKWFVESGISKNSKVVWQRSMQYFWRECVTGALIMPFLFSLMSNLCSAGGIMFTSCDSFNFLRNAAQLNNQESTTATCTLTLNTSIQFMFSVRVERSGPLCDNVHSSSDQAAGNSTDKRKVLLTAPYEVWLTKLRPRPWPYFEFTLETIEPRLDLASLSGHCRTTRVVFEQSFCSQLYLRIGHLRLMCDELPNAPGMVSLEFTVSAIYLASLLLASPDINHTGFFPSSATVTNLKLQLIAFSDESLHVGLLLHKTHGQQHRSNLQAGGDEWKLLKPNFLQASFGPCSDAYFSGNQYRVVVDLLLHPVGQVSDRVQRWRSQYPTGESNKITYNYSICVGIPVVGSGLLLIELELLIPQPGEHLALLPPKPPCSPLVPPQFSTEFSGNMQTNSEFLHLAGILWEITPLWICADHVNILSSHWWCFSWGTYPDADVFAECLGRSIPKEFQITAQSNEQHAVRSVQPTTSSYAHWDPGGLDFAELAKNGHRLGGKPAVKEEGMSATQLQPQPAHQGRPAHGPGPSRTSRSYQLYIYRSTGKGNEPGIRAWITKRQRRLLSSPTFSSSPSSLLNSIVLELDSL